MARAPRRDILNAADDSRWRAVLDRVQEHDFCHLPAFHRLAERCGQGTARLLVLQHGDVTIAFPVLLRDIPLAISAGLNTARKDVTSVYGYAGPVSSPRVVPADLRCEFLHFLADFLQDHGVVSAFSRLHPLLPQIGLLAGHGEVRPVGWTLSLDLGQSEQEQWSGYRRNHRQDIKKLLEMGVVCEEVGAERLDDFIAMYYTTMDRVGAASQYYFSPGYFERLLADLPGVAHLFLCTQGNVPIAGGIFTLCRGIVQWYFSGTCAEYGGPPPTKLLFEVVRKWANQMGAHTIHLGGGVGGAKDSLYHFKTGFTHREHVYAVWRCIVDQAAYDDLCCGARARSRVEVDDAFFPRYRHPAFATGLEQVR